MTPAAVSKLLKVLSPGDAVEILWHDACTNATKWLDHKEAKALTLATILTRGTFVALENDAVKIALDCGVHEDGSVWDFHSIGVIERGAIKDIAKMRRLGRMRGAMKK